MNETVKNKLSDQIWTTRTSRINAEKRLKSTASFVEAINIYYSCFTVLLSIILLSEQSYTLSLLTLSMTIILTISILFFKSLQYSERARNYRKNYTELQKLEFQLSHISTEKELEDIEQQYCVLLDDAENHIPFDYYKTVAESRGDYKTNRWTCDIKFKYYRGLIWRYILKFVIILLPIALVIIILWGQKYGWFSGT